MTHLEVNFIFGKSALYFYFCFPETQKCLISFEGISVCDFKHYSSIRGQMRKSSGKKRICPTLAAVPCSQHLECRACPHTVQPAWESIWWWGCLCRTLLRQTQMFSLKRGGSFAHSLYCKAKTFWWLQDEHIVRKKNYCICRERCTGKEMHWKDLEQLSLPSNKLALCMAKNGH